MRREDGRMHRVDTIRYWLNRFHQTNDVKEKRRTGRPKLLDEQQEKTVVKLIKENPKKRYTKLRSLLLEKNNISIRRRTLNNYALRNDFGMFTT